MFLLLYSLFLYEKEPVPVKKKVPGAGAGQKRTGSATLLLTFTNSLLKKIYLLFKDCLL